jgi:hypothetical protein
MLRRLYPWGKSPQYPLDTRLGRLQSQSGGCGEEKNLPYNVYRPIKTGSNRAEFSEEGYGSKSAVLPMMMV